MSYWKLVDRWESNNKLACRETFEHVLPDGGMLVMVRQMTQAPSQQGSGIYESVQLLHVPATSMTTTQGPHR